MVSETSSSTVMSDGCVDFTQHAWKKDVCCNCQRPRSEHPSNSKTENQGKVENQSGSGVGLVSNTEPGTDSPKPAKRNSIMTKSWTAIQADAKADDSEEDQWNSMCLPDPDNPNKRLDETDHPNKRLDETDHPNKRLNETDLILKKSSKTKEPKYFPEHSYEDIDGDNMKLGQRSNKDSSKSVIPGQDSVNDDGNTKITTTVQKTTISINPEDRLTTLIRNGPQLPSNKSSRSRSSSREKSPAPAPKPKVSEKPIVCSKKTQDSVITQKTNNETMQKKGTSSPKVKKRSITFVERDPSVIGDDGGLDNLYSDTEDDIEDKSEPREAMEFTEYEKDWALQALKNTLWNGDQVNEGDKKVTITHSKEFEDINKVETLLTSDGFANVQDCEPESYNFGTFPLKKKSEKTVMNNMFSSNRLSTLSESSENVTSDVEDKYESVLRFLGAGKLDNFMASPKHKSAVKSGDNEGDMTESSYDDPWEDKFEFGDNSEMNLLDEIKGEIDLDSSSAGFALVDLLNDVLAKYSTGTPSETDSVRNLDLLDDKLDRKYEGNEKSDRREGKMKPPAELEARMVTLAANLRKHRAKGRAPRPPSCPPEPPQDGTTSPAKQAELRAAQSKEPTFKMVPLGKSIGPNPLLQAANSTPILPSASSLKPDISSTSSSNSSDNMEGYKGKGDKDKQVKKGGGGIGGFFSRFFGRGKDSETDLTASSESLQVNTWSLSDPYCEVDNQSDKGSHSDKASSEKGDNSKERRTSKSSPQMKMKVLPPPNRPVSPRPTEKPPLQPDIKKDIEKDAKSDKKGSPQPEVRGSKVKDNVKTEKSDKNASQKSSSPKLPEQSKAQLSPAKTEDKDHPKATSPKSKEAPPLPQNPPRELSDGSAPPKPRARGNSDGGPPRSRPRKRDSIDGRPRDTPNVPPPKPPVAVKPKPQAGPTKSLDITDSISTKPVTKQRLSSTSSLEEVTKSDDVHKRTEIQRSTDPKVLRKRAKSPKRFAAPLAPGRASLPNVLTDSNVSLASTTSEISVQSLPVSQTDTKTEPKNLAFALELEQKLHKDQAGALSDVRKLNAPPALPTSAPKIDHSEKSKSLPVDKAKTAPPEKSKSVPVDKAKTAPPEKLKSLPTDCKKIASKDKDIPQATSSPKDTSRSRSTSKDDLKLSPPTLEDKSKTVLTSSATPSSTETDHPSQPSGPVPSTEITIQPEKIELPKSAGNSRKSFLGKLNRNKNKPPPPPSVKRTKSITETALLGDHQMKKIDLKDISGPVLITDMTNSKVVSRRNTISIGDDNSFLSGGSTSSGSTSAGEKCDLSPRGSVENLYEFITSEAPTPPVGDKKNLYDPVVENVVVGLRPPSMTGSEGYLEPVRANQGQSEPVNSNMAESTISMGSMTTSFVTMTSNMADINKSTTENFENPYGKNDPGLDNLDISDERRNLLANQPIYEEITNGYGKLGSSVDDAQNSGNYDGPQEEVYGVSSDQSQNIGINPSTSSLKKKESFSSDSEVSSANSSLSRPRPIPRKRPRQIGSGFEQYVAMNRPNVAVVLNEDQLREMLSKLTAMNLNTIKEIYTQHEKCFTKENLDLGSVGPLKWHDFDIYGKPLHTSEKCVVYNAKMRTTMFPCQVMLLHSRPEITSANHPSLLKPTCIFTDSVPFSYLTEEFIKTSQILETCVNQSNSNMAKCYIVVGLFDITESLTHHMNSLETICENQKDFLRKVLFVLLQLLSAISHCLEQGHPLTEIDFHDLYLISNPYCLGETVSFLPQVRAPEDQRIDRVCLFLEQFLQDMCAKCEASAVLDDSAFFTYTGIQKVMELLESGVAECFPIVRSYTEFLLWGPAETDPEFHDDRQSNIEPKLAMWLEKQRAELIHDFARRVQHGARCNIKDFYMMKFLLKASSGSLSECIRCHAAATAS